MSGGDIILLLIAIFALYYLLNNCNNNTKTNEQFDCIEAYPGPGGVWGCCNGNPPDREFYAGYHYCLGMPQGTNCFSDAMCDQTTNPPLTCQTYPGYNYLGVCTPPND